MCYIFQCCRGLYFSNRRLRLRFKWATELLLERAVDLTLTEPQTVDFNEAQTIVFMSDNLSTGMIDGGFVEWDETKRNSRHSGGNKRAVNSMIKRYASLENRASYRKEPIWVAIYYAQTASGGIPWPLSWLWSQHDACFFKLPLPLLWLSFLFIANVSGPTSFSSVTLFLISPTHLHNFFCYCVLILSRIHTLKMYYPQRWKRLFRTR